MLIDELISQIEAADLALKEKGSEVIAEYVKSLFEAHPLIKEFRWDQYTPGFNDGDPCTFSTGEMGLYLTNGQQIGYHTEDEDDEEEVVKISEAEEKVLDNVLRQFAKKIWAMNDHLERLFGNDVTVIVGRNGTKTEDYDCGY